jgi:hypothetical protein
VTRRPTDLKYEDGRTASYESIRLHILELHPVCQVCECEASTEVDHIWPRYYGGTDHRRNLQATCRPCNRSKANTVDLTAAETVNIYRAGMACYQRALVALGDLDRFDEALADRGFAHGSQRENTLALIRHRVQCMEGLAKAVAGRTAAMRDALTAADGVSEIDAEFTSGVMSIFNQLFGSFEEVDA